MSGCHSETSGCGSKRKRDYLLWGSLAAIVVGYLTMLLGHTFDLAMPTFVHHYAMSIYELVHKMWWGILLGMFAVGLLGKIPREFVMSVLGRNGGFTGILRATAGGVALDLCSHGVLMVGLRLYERGATLGQTMAFLIASPWNSLSLTFILFSLVGLKLTVLFIVLSALIAIISGLVFEALVTRGVLPGNPHRSDMPADFKFMPAARAGLQATQFNGAFWRDVLRQALTESRMVLRWILFGMVLASVIRVVLSPEHWENYFGPTALGLLLTMVAATVIEVCSEGSTPIAADLVTRAKAPGNGFAFLMTGVSTDFTEIMGIKERTNSWKIALFLPLVTIPQVIALAILLNYGA